jgi:hypothetical protein
MTALAAKRYSALWLIIPALCIGVPLAETLYSGVRLLAPQRTSQGYKDLLSRRLRVPPIIIIPVGPNGPTMSADRYLEATRQAAMERELTRERRDATHGLTVWGIALIVSSVACWAGGTALRRRSVGAV